ncbi:hypothetical protein D3C80_1160560 [compost metagenome]
MTIGINHHIFTAIQREFDILLQRIGNVLGNAFTDFRVDIHRFNLQWEVFRLQFGQINQLARKRCGAIQPLLHVFNDFLTFGFIRHLGQQVQLCQYGGDRGAQLMRRIGHKTLFTLVGSIDARHQLIDFQNDWPDFLILFGRIDRRQSTGLAVRDHSGNLPQRPQAEISGKQ